MGAVVTPLPSREALARIIEKAIIEKALRPTPPRCFFRGPIDGPCDDCGKPYDDADHVWPNDPPLKEKLADAILAALGSVSAAPLEEPAEYHAPGEHPEKNCGRCQRPNVWSWHAPSPLWNAVMRDPETGRDRYSVVCPPCFAELAEQAVVPAQRHTWHFEPHGVDVAALWADEDGRTWDATQCLWVESGAGESLDVERANRVDGALRSLLNAIESSEPFMAGIHFEGGAAIRNKAREARAVLASRSEPPETAPEPACRWHPHGCPPGMREAIAAWVERGRTPAPFGWRQHAPWSQRQETTD